MCAQAQAPHQSQNCRRYSEAVHAERQPQHQRDESGVERIDLGNERLRPEHGHQRDGPGRAKSGDSGAWSGRAPSPLQYRQVQSQGGQPCPHRRHQIEPPGDVPQRQARKQTTQQAVDGIARWVGHTQRVRRRDQIAAVAAIVGPGDGRGKCQQVDEHRDSKGRQPTQPAQHPRPNPLARGKRAPRRHRGPVQGKPQRLAAP